MKYILLILFLFLSACSTLSPVELRQKNTLDCVKDLKITADTDTREGFEVCRQIYGVRKLKETQ
jgi:hypothetical protein